MKSNCPVCGREKVYKTPTGYRLGQTRPCRSCANSISAGGTGWSPFCFQCKTTDDLVIDHSHETKEVRGILCRQCNLGIGSLQDREDLLENAYKYLKEFNWTSRKKF